ncbi:hypothetical protein N2152v2_001947 [Parachlorella kessleri]
MDSTPNNDDATGLIPQLSRLEVSSAAHQSSDPQTPIDSPLTLDNDLRDWLNAALSAAAANPKVYIKLLVSNAAAGSIIGKGGGNINDFQQKTFAKIQLSKASEYFPGTVERILMLTGRLKQVVAALGLIFSKLSREGVAPLSPKSKAAAAAAAGGPASPMPAAPPSPSLRLLVKLLVPQSLCGIIIGRSGSTIRQFAADTQTNIKVTAADGPSPPLSHRIVTVSGHQDGVVKAVALLTLKMSEDHKFSLFSSLPVAPAGAAVNGSMPSTPASVGTPGATQGMQIMHSMAMPSPYATAPMQPMPYMHLAAGPGGLYATAPPHIAFAPQRSLSGELGEGAGGGYTCLAISLTEEQGTFLLGTDGRGAADVAQASGVRLRVEREVRPGSKAQYRKLILQGPADAVHCAQWMLGQKLAMATAAVTGFAAAAASAPPGMLAGPAAAAAYMQQQVAGTTYFTQAPMMPAPGPHYSPQALAAAMPAAFAMPHPQGMGGPQHVRMVAVGVPQAVQIRGGAPL